MIQYQIQHMVTVNQTFVILVITSIIVLNVVWIYNGIENWLSELASLITIISVVFTPIYYFLKKSSDKKNNTQQMVDNLLGDLEDTLGGLKDEKNKKEFKLIYDGNTKVVSYTHKIFNHDIYDSFIYTGKINFVGSKVQQKIQDVFKYIKQHNRYLEHIVELQGILSENDGKQAPTQYYMHIADTEQKLLKLLPDLKDELKRITR